jgi:hypothetical protein
VKRLTLAVAFWMAMGEPSALAKRTHSGRLGKKQCELACQHLLACAGWSFEQSATLAEFLICFDDCTIQSGDPRRRPGWACATETEDCAALTKCEAGGVRDK